MPALVVTGLLLSAVFLGAACEAEPKPPAPQKAPTAGLDERDQLPDLHMSNFLPNPNPLVQAIGSTHQREDRQSTDRQARLQNASRLGALSLGYELRNPKSQRDYGTYELVELIRQVGVRFDELHEGEVFMVGDLSLKQGGTIRNHSGSRVHSSHRNGLDVDIDFLRTDCHGGGSQNASDCPPAVEANLELMQLFLDSGPPLGPVVDLFYVHHDFHERACNFVYASEERHEQYAQALRYMEARDGHQVHFHMRIRCPAMSRGCPPSPPPPTRDGCNRRLAASLSKGGPQGG